MSLGKALETKIYHQSQSLLVIGGGRWAREIIGVLKTILSKEDVITACSKIHYDQLISWIKQKDFLNVNAIQEIKHLNLSDYSAVIIVNSARDHFDSAMMMMNHNLPVLVEKPIAFTTQQFHLMIKNASERNLLLASANVFLFSTFINNFSEVIRDSKPKKIELVWTDQKSNLWSYGERLYDSSISVFQDVLPHVFSIFQIVFPNAHYELQSFTLERGGAKIIITVLMGEVDCLITLERNATLRQRKLIVNSEDDIFCYDFKVEPPSIYKNGRILKSFSKENKYYSPLTNLISKFLSALKDGVLDFRLNPKFSLLPCQFIDLINASYKEKLRELISDELKKDSRFKDDLIYALEEILQEGSRLTRAELDVQIETYFQLA